MTTPTQTGDKPMVTRELLTCPFCDGEADFGTRPYKNSLWSIHCSGCTAYRVGQTRAEAIAAWNTRAQETLSPEQPLDTIQRLGQEFDAPEATPSLGMGENERAALVRAAEFLDSCAGADIEVDGVTAISVVEELHSLLPETWDDCFHVEAARYLEHLTSPSPDVGLAEENERLRPMEDAPKDGRYIIAAYRSLDGYAEQLHGRSFIIRHEGTTPSGYDLGWALFPGHGGVPDKCFSGWLPLPTTLQSISTGNP